ncbi:hypothetical protein CRE_28653 [Caenorhabditis remanei]|uniref:Uncharacterized protein n=1 Tax=Caenorhabditis remanei TaxID=31234 RepID=E3MJU9_CAERE|nr:hypothetical protein CRE_28653 [Caenorhabditis remanei]
MNKLLICAVFVSFPYYCHSAILDELFDINDVENKACKDGCETENYRTCPDICVPEMAVLPYKQAKEMAERVRPPINPCMDIVSACNYETMDSYENLRTENPFLYI